MNPILEAKLIELMEEAERHAAPAMCAVLDMLYGAYINGKQNEFASHCCRLSPIQTNEVMARKTDKVDDFFGQPMIGNYGH